MFEPSKSGASHPNYFHEIATTQYEGKSKEDTVWFLMKTLSPTLSKDVPTWATYNSLLRKKPTRTAGMMLPVTNSSSTNWNNLYGALEEADKLRESVYCDGKMIVTFDLQLYIKAVQLHEKVDIKSNFVFRMGKLHVVFCVLKVIGKVIDGSGLDQAFEEAGKITINCIKIEIRTFNSYSEGHFREIGTSLIESNMCI